MTDDKKLFRAAKKRADKHRKGDGKTCVTCPASRHAQMIAEAVGARRPYPMLQEEPEHCAGSILSAVGSLYEARLLLAQGRTLTATECAALREAADYLEGDGVSMPAMRADVIAITLRHIADQHGAALASIAQPQEPRTRQELHDMVAKAAGTEFYNPSLRQPQSDPAQPSGDEVTEPPLLADGTPAWQSCPNAHECINGGRYGKGVFEDDLQSAAGGKPWQECHCGVRADGSVAAMSTEPKP